MSNGIVGLANGGPPVMRGGVLPRWVPLNIRQLGADVAGKFVRERMGMEGLGNLIGSRDITEHDLSPGEYAALQEAALRSMGGELRGSGRIGYRHYDTGDDPYADVGGGRLTGAIGKLFDPSYSMKTTFGQAGVERDPETGDYYLTDQYNFNERQPGPTSLGEFGDILEARAGQGAYGIPRAIGQAFGSPEGEGSRARINLGPRLGLPEEDKPGMLARGIEGLRNMFARGEPRRRRTPGIVPASAEEEIARLEQQLRPITNPIIQ